jgi:TRAP transporter 4TM/12TM fusion protein
MNRFPPAAANGVIALSYAVALFFLFYLFTYYWTGLGGPVLLAMTLIPVTYILFVLYALRMDDFYPSLSPTLNLMLAGLYIVVAAAIAVYMNHEYEDIGMVRAGMPNAADLTFGGLMVLLIMEYARKRHMPLFVLNIALILYAVYGKFVPGMFYHPGLSWTRVNGAMTLEMSTGIFSDLPQIALTVVGSFLLVLSGLRAFGCIGSILSATSRIALRAPAAIPQSAVIGSMCVGMVSGSGAANAITIGSATIPAMKSAGIPGAQAAAIESAASTGGQIMPPVMGVAAFLMAEFLGKSYFDVVARGYIPALIYYVSVAISVYLLSCRFRVHNNGLKIDPVSRQDWINVAAFIAAVGGLVLLMATIHLAPMFAALYMFITVTTVLGLIHIATTLAQRGSLTALIEPFKNFVDIFCDMISDLALLLATLSVMTAALVITGVPTKLGSLLMAAGGVNLAAMVVMAFIFGSILGTGLPPAPTYIITALVIAPPMIQVGVNPWVVHFFAFFLAIWGELTPPTSLVAAVTAKIADASFMEVMFRMLQICVSLFTMMVGVFTHPALVIEPGMAQLGAALLVLIATVGITFAIQARFTDRPAVDRPIRGLLGVLSLIVLVYPSDEVAAAICLPVLAFVAYWLMRRRAALPAPAATAAQ